MGHRIRIVGCPGSGKSTLAAELARRHGLAHIELDGLFHLPGWEPRPTDEFRQLVDERTRAAEGGWVMDGNYCEKVGAPGTYADTIVWLDLARHVVMRRLVRRSLVRALTRQRLWSGNRERLRDLLRPRPEENIVLWGWVKHPVYRARYAAQMRDGWRELEVHRLRSPGEVERFVETFRPS